MDAVQKANSGHPGTPMALAPLAYVLYTRVMEHAPSQPDWPDRDRFVLSCGHASMLLYSTLYLTGYGLTLDDLKNFRQLGSPTAGHPEYGHAAGIETTTGPLGQGISTAVGMALAERMLAERFNRDGHEIVDHYTYVIASDGDLQEGVASEASSLAGHLGLGKLIAFWDDNHISIEGDTALVVHRGRRRALRGLRLARPEPRRGHRAGPHRGGAGQRPRGHRPAEPDRRPHAHRPRLAEQAGHARRARRAAGRRGDQAHQGGLRLPEPGAVLRRRRGARALPRLRSSAARSPRRSGASASRPTAADLPAEAAEFERILAAQAARRLGRRRARRRARTAGMIATRKASQDVIQWAAAQVPELVGGSADLAPSTLTLIKGARQRRARRLRRPQPALRHPRARHGRDRQRPHAARPAGVRRRLLHLQRLHEGVAAPGRDHAASRPSSCSRTTRSAWARTARRTSRSSSSRRCARRRTSTSCAPRASTRPRWPGASRCSATETPTALALSRQGVPTWDPAARARRRDRARRLRARGRDGEPELILMALGHRGPHRPRRREAARPRRASRCGS